MPTDADVDIQALRSVLHSHPVRVAVLFGSSATGSTDGRSDVDIAIEFDGSVENTVATYMAILTDISIALDRNDIDLSLVRDLDPRVGHEAFDHGILLCGSEERARTLRDQFEAERPETPSTETLRDRFDDALANVDSELDGEA
jgi:predicted nucleotidyltransferase